MKGRFARLYYEACIPATLAVLIAWHHGISPGTIAGTEQQTKGADSHQHGYMLGLVIVAMAVVSLLLRVGTRDPLNSQMVRAIVLPGTKPAMYRPEADDGAVWGGLLVPLVLMAMSVGSRSDGQEQGQGLTKQGACIVGVAMSCSFLLTAALNAFMQGADSVDNKRRQVQVYQALGVRLLVWIAVSVGFSAGLQQPLFRSLTLGSVALFGAISVQSSLTSYIVRNLPYSFTLGEAAAAAQGTTLLALDLGAKLLARLHCDDIGAQREHWEAGLELLCLEAAVVGLLLLAWATASTAALTRHSHPGGYISVARFGTLAGACGAGSLLLIAYISNINPVLWVLRLVFGSTAHLVVIAYWVLLLAGAAAAYALAITSSVANSRSKFVLHLKRKSYHLLATLMFVPGFIFAPRLLHLGFTVALVAFVLVECIRAFGIGAWSRPIGEFICKFTDHRDAGRMVTSHFYLLFGCALPVWLGGPSVVACLSGVLSLGMADAAASLVGMKLGRTRWPASPKTVEGTLGFVVCLFAAVELVYLASSLAHSQPAAPQSPIGWVQCLAMCSVSGVLEALTEQNDNLVIPLFMYAAAHALASISHGDVVAQLGPVVFVAVGLALPHAVQAQASLCKALPKPTSHIL